MQTRPALGVVFWQGLSTADGHVPARVVVGSSCS
jgi:hypothetical protein